MSDALLNKMKTLAASYAPEWSFNPEEPDAGTVIALLYKDMLEGSEERLNKVLHKHKIQYLNLFDRFKAEQAEAAKSFVQFTPVAGAPQPVHIPKGTRLLAEGQMAFETTHGITATTANISAIYTTDGASGVISRVYDGKEKVENIRITAFDAGDENLKEHVLLLGFRETFDHLSALDLLLFVDDDEALDVLCDKDNISFSVLCESGLEPFDKAEREGNAIRLKKEYFVPGKAELSGRECCQLAITAERPAELQLSGFSIRFAADDILPDEVRCAGVAQNIAHFRPFGVPMELYSACEIESRALFARKGARTEMIFTLGFEQVERLLPEYEMQEEYKVIMKQQAPAPRPVETQAHADYVLVEYLSVTGWKRLLKEEHAALLFNGSAVGGLRLSFTMPEDMLPDTLAQNQPRLRLRLIRSDNLYSVPGVQFCPVITGLSFSYSYDAAPMRPDVILTRNNFEYLDVTGKSFTPFYTREHEKPAMYLGFDKNPWGTPVSIYLRLENNAEYPVDFTAEYLSPRGFLPIKAYDGTLGLLHSGALCAVVPQDAAAGELFGRRLWWLRLINHNRDNKTYNLPVINGIYMNMAKVENLSTRTQLFYIDNNDSDVVLTLDAQGLVSVKVYVNEEDSSKDGENWVLWQPARHREDADRVFDADLQAGQVRFSKSAFAAYPVMEDGPAVKVVHQSYHGSAANVEAGRITSLASSIRFISGVSNPLPAYGGYDGGDEAASAAVISNMLRTRGRAVTRQDYFDIISQVSYGVRAVKCLSGQNLKGEPQADTLVVAVLIDEYEKGGHIFSGVKEAIREKLPAGKKLVLTQPRFVRMSARLWLECETMESAYDLQKDCVNSIKGFIDPLSGGFGGRGWEIGELPTPTQLVAFLKIRHPGVVVARLVVTALYENREYAVDNSIKSKIANPLAMAVNGEHVVYVNLG